MCVSVRDIAVRVDNARTKQIEWVKAVLEYKGWAQTELARRAGVDPSTLSRFLREVNPGANLNANTVIAIERAGGIPAFETEAPTPMRGFAETEAAAYIGAPDDPVAAAVAAICKGRNGIDPWVMKSRALENAGILPGDVLVVDLNARAFDGDTVCAQLFDRTGHPTTAFRLYEKPFLVTASHDPALRRPVLVDNDRAQVRGVVLASIRPRLVH